MHIMGSRKKKSMLVQLKIRTAILGRRKIPKNGITGRVMVWLWWELMVVIHNNKINARGVSILH